MVKHEITYINLILLHLITLLHNLFIFEIIFLGIVRYESNTKRLKRVAYLVRYETNTKRLKRVAYLGDLRSCVSLFWNFA